MYQTKANTKIMGIVNTTPDSFSGDGKTCTDTAIQHALALVDAGADILDIGGESTRPQSHPVDTQTEITRVIPVLQGIRAKNPHIPISIDTSKAQVAQSALDAGATMINDVWGGTKDPHILHVAKHADCPICLMHNRSNASAIYHTDTGTSYVGTHEDTFIQTLLSTLTALAENALTHGIKPENIILDPGVGFGKTLEQNLLILKHLDAIKDLGYMLLLGTSRKSFIGEVLGVHVHDRTIGTLATTAIAVQHSIDIVRVHDVCENFQTVRMLHAIYGA